MKICIRCGLTETDEPSMEKCELCGGEIVDIESLTHVWYASSNPKSRIYEMYCMRTNRETYMAWDIVRDIEYCPFCKEVFEYKPKIRQ